MLKKVSLVTMGNMFNAFLGFLYLWAVANSLSLEQFGKYSLFVSLVVVLGRLTDFGTNSIYVTNSILRNPKSATFIYTKVLLTLTACFIGLAILKITGLFDLIFAVILVGGIFSYGLIYTLYAFYQKEEKYGLLVLLYTVPAVIKAIFAGLFHFQILSTSVELAGAVFSLSIAAGVVLLIMDNPLKGLKLSLKKRPLELIKESWPAGISQTITEMWPALSNSIAKTLHGFSQVGIFALANKVSAIFSLLSLSIFTVLLPKNAKRKKQELKYSFDEVALISMVLLLIGIVGVIVSRFVVTNFFSPQFKDSLDLLNILIFAGVLTAIATFMENYFFVEETTKKILAINLAKLGAFTLGILALTPSLALKGLAYSQLIAGLVAVMVTAIFMFTAKRNTLVKKMVDKIK